ncbi:MAG TPA: FkbM family methyltransferase [Puia sp.]|nr:FkbM family methyltransferase [Puia sp.]
MRPVKKLLKKALGLDPMANVKPLKNLVYIGSKYHGYTIPPNIIKRDSICYCIGAGEDISFDTELKVLYDAKIFIFDPMPEGKNYFVKLKEYTRNGKVMTIEGENSFTYRINSEQLDDMVYVEKGVWDEATTLRFYAPKLEDYVSHSAYLFKSSDKFIDAPVDRLSNFMKSFGHQSIDLVKMEIEGAEYTVLDTIVRDQLDVKIIVVEFDEVFHSNGLKFLYRIKKTSDELEKAGWILVHSTPMFKRTFIRQDLYQQLKAAE